MSKKTAPEITVRKAVAADAAALIAFNQAMARETEARELAVEVITPGVTTLLENPQHGFYLVAENAQSSEVVGSLMITSEWSDWRNGLFWWVQSVYVRADYRRQGIYRQLYRHAQGLAERHKEVCGFRLYVERDNAAAQATYRALGMSETPYRLFEALNKPD